MTTPTSPYSPPDFNWSPPELVFTPPQSPSYAPFTPPPSPSYAPFSSPSWEWLVSPLSPFGGSESEWTPGDSSEEEESDEEIWVCTYQGMGTFYNPILIE